MYISLNSDTFSFNNNDVLDSRNLVMLFPDTAFLSARTLSEQR